MKRLVSLLFGIAVSVCVGNVARAATSYTFQEVVYPHDTFTQLLGINNSSIIAGYHGATVNKGFVYTLSTNTFTNENFPHSAQTQVIGINNSNQNDGFYIDSSGVTHGFLDNGGKFVTVTYPSTAFNQLLGLNDQDQAAGYFGNAAGGANRGYFYDEIGGPLGKGAFFQLNVAGGVSQQQVTGINNSGQISGFYIDTVGNTHGFLIRGGTFTDLDFPAATFTQALGLNNNGQVVGTYTDSSNASHGFVYTVATATFNSVDDPSGVGTTVINGTNDAGLIVGFYVDSSGNTDGFVGTPEAP